MGFIIESLLVLSHWRGGGALHQKCFSCWSLKGNYIELGNYILWHLKKIYCMRSSFFDNQKIWPKIRGLQYMGQIIKILYICIFQILYKIIDIQKFIIENCENIVDIRKCQCQHLIMGTCGQNDHFMLSDHDDSVYTTSYFLYTMLCLFYSVFCCFVTKSEFCHILRKKSIRGCS